MDEAQVTQTGDQANQQQSQSLGWRSALPDEWKEHEFVKDCAKPGDFVTKAHKIKTELDGLSEFKTQKDALEARLAKAIFKPGENARPEEIAAYRKSIGVPEKAEEYAFPEGDGVKHDPAMIAWAQKTFHEAGLSKEQATAIGSKWDGFIKGMVEAEEKMAEEAKVKNQEEFRKQFKTEDEYKAGTELSKRFWKKVTNTDFEKAFEEAEGWQVPLFMNFIFQTAKLTGEDTSPRGTPPEGQEVKIGMNYRSMDAFKGG